MDANQSVSPPPGFSFPPNRSSRGRSRYPYWKTRDGARMRLEDMKESHLRNCLAWMDRTAKDLFSDVGMCWDSIDGQGPCMPPHCPEDLLPPAYDHMVAELRRRGLAVIAALP